MPQPVLIRGGGDLATGVASAFFRAGYRVAVVECPRPRAIRRTVAFAQAVYAGRVEVENIAARSCTPGEIENVWADGVIPVVVDPEAELRHHFTFPVLVDAIMSKTNAGGTGREWAPLVIGLGPGFVAGRECHLVIETKRGHRLGRFYARGTAEPDSGEPSLLGGEAARRVVRAPVAGQFTGLVVIGSLVRAGDVLARIGEVEVRATLSGVLRGLLASGVEVAAGEKVADIDPRGCPDFCHLISDRARLVGLGALAGTLWWERGRPGLLPAGPDPS